ncbi:MAG: mechanosensitive ion channel [Armatimonadetes bacterium]|nr:mechanosensitive ion channel [Armatimonadota bacterium]NIM24091.1 mechanosensitive ion channel [Armatimonadota bacterium]NIM67945.1 mechanosensitive ion channel [Armatimonadota bacterium]NIM76467.1 mechanosensitive ion channel [Armatimonadota bacterium]NIN06175.1 mechanosensitive ion channel [Armatimonadota bacterium]
MLETLSSSARDLLGAATILAAFLLAMLLVRLLWLSVFRPFIKRTRTELDDVLILPLRSLVVWGILLLGINHSLASLEAVQANPRFLAILDKVLGVAWVLLFAWIAWRVFSGVLTWYVQNAAARPEGARDVSHQASFARKAVNILILAVGILYILRMLEVDISPLLAGGAIGGLAIALALQDTLSNFFAGIYLAIDKPLSEGDFIKLESGEEGFVEEIGWRNTKVRLWANNIVVIPNSKLSQSVITNYFLPQQEMSVYVWCGVAYDSDLQRVEDVAVEVAKQVMQQVEGSSLDWEPVVRWKEFGDFAITFVTILRVREFGVQYALASEFVKALHRRFKKEGIEIPFPIRTVIMKSPAPAAIDMQERGEIERS